MSFSASRIKRTIQRTRKSSVLSDAQLLAITNFLEGINKNAGDQTGAKVESNETNQDEFYTECS